MENIALFVSENINPFYFAIPNMVFSDLPPVGHRRRILRCAVRPGVIPMGNGLSVSVEYGLEAFEKASLIIIPFWPDPTERPSPELIAALRTAYRQGRHIMALCRGGFVLGYAGLLDGRRAATHWYDARLFRELFPAVELDENVLYVEEEGMTTSAGVAAGIDCSLHVLRKLEGAKVANGVARLMVAPPFREGGQAQFIEEPLPTRTKDDRINAVIELFQNRLGETIDLAQAARSAAMSERTFYRAFRRSTGMTPHQWLLTARLKRAQERLELSDDSVERIALECGFESPITFRQRFREMFGTAPSVWRKNFRPEA